MSAILIPHPYQLQMHDHMIEHDRSALFAGMGLGKTSTSLLAIDSSFVLDPGRTLVIAPKRVAQSTWPDEIKKWDNFRNLECSVIVGDPAERRAALKRDASVYTTNYENLPWLIEEIGKRPWPFKRVIADESTKLKNFRLSGGGRRARELGKVAHKHAQYWTNLTGTPAPKGLIDLWGQMWFVDAGQRLGRTVTSFKDRFFETQFIPNAADPKARAWPELVPREFAAAQIQQLLADVCMTVEAKDHFKLPELIVNKIMVELPSKAMKTYREMEKKLYTEIKGNGIEAFNAGAKTGKCHQIANGAVYLTEELGDDESRKSPEWVEIHDAKIQVLDSILDESSGAPVLVAYHFKSDLARLQRAFPHARVLDDDPDTIVQWNRGAIPLLFAHPASAGHGLNLQHGGNILVYFSVSWNNENHAQILERIGPTRQAQSGYDRPVFVHYILAADTVDEDIVERLETNESIQSILMKGLKRRIANV